MVKWRTCSDEQVFVKYTNVNINNETVDLLICLIYIKTILYCFSFYLYVQKRKQGFIR